MMNKNVFVKPNGQSRAYANYAMARKRRMKFNVFSESNGQSRVARTALRQENDG